MNGGFRAALGGRSRGLGRRAPGDPGAGGAPGDPGAGEARGAAAGAVDGDGAGASAGFVADAAGAVASAPDGPVGRPVVRCRSVTVVLGGREVLSDLDLEVGRGEMVALLGASGAGKTTLLGAIAGFVPLAAGEIEIGGVRVATPAGSVPPERRRIGVVFQDYALWPQMTARQIVAYPLVVRGVRRREAEGRAEAWLARVGLDGMADRRPGQLSGGQQQRVGLARAMIAEPGLLLCDEPTANLDAVLRGGLQQEIREQQRRSGAAGVYVTHDPAEAFDVADRVAVLDQGRLAQVGAPSEIYARPSSAAVASLTGAYRLLRAEAVAAGKAKVLGVEVDCDGGAAPGSDRGARAGGGLLLVRPEWLEVGPAGGPGLAGRVLATHYRGGYTDYDVDSRAGRLLARVPGEPRWAVGEAVSCTPRRGWPVPEMDAEPPPWGGDGPGAEPAGAGAPRDAPHGEGGRADGSGG